MLSDRERCPLWWPKGPCSFCRPNIREQIVVCGQIKSQNIFQMVIQSVALDFIAVRKISPLFGLGAGVGIVVEQVE